MENEDIQTILGIEDRILQLIYRAKTFLNWAEDIRVFYEQSQPQDVVEKQSYISDGLVRYLVLHHNLYIFEVILDLNTLLKKTKRSKELSFEYYFSQIKNNDKIDKIRDDYENSVLGELRNKIIAHKDLKNAGDPFAHFFALLRFEIFDKAKKIVSNLEQASIDIFKEPISNNYFESYYGGGVKEVLEIIKSKIREKYGQASN